MMASTSRSSRPIAARSLLLAVLLSLLAACAPFRHGSSGEGVAADPGRAVLEAAETRIGAPYRYGGSGPEAFDCSGLVAYAHRQAGIAVPRTAAEQFSKATPVKRRELRPGDLVFFRLSGRDVGHVGIYAGDDRFVHAPQSGGHVRLASLEDEWYRQRFVGAGRFYTAPQ
jgi:cell wall-associated NlpC family hydrolase